MEFIKHCLDITVFCVLGLISVAIDRNGTIFIDDVKNRLMAAETQWQKVACDTSFELARTRS